MPDTINTRGIAASAESLRERIQNEHTKDESTAGRQMRDEETGDFPEFVAEDLREYTGIDDVEKYMHFDEWPDDEELPEWVGTFRNLLESLLEADEPESIPQVFETTFPFEEILFRIAEYSSRTFIDVDTDRLSERAFRDFQNYLVGRLADVGALALHMDFMAYIADHDPGVIREDSRSPDSTFWYDEYTSDFFDGRAVTFFEKFPVLARVFTVVIRQWGLLVSRFLSRLHDDYDSISSLFDTDDLGRVASLRPGAGDPHDGGQTVIVVEFESGDEIVYKPRSVAPEKEFYGFEEWLHEDFEDFPELQTLDVIENSTHGWVEKVEPGTFPDPESIRDYYRRAGALLCVLHVLNASDCHFENLVAGDISPVIIDGETLFHTPVPIAETSNANTNVKVQEWMIRSSVLKTSMVPYALEDQPVNRSALGMVEEYEARVLELTWEHVNTDAMDFDHRHPTVVPESNYPTYDGDPEPSSQYIEEIVGGFDTAYNVILDSKETVKREITERFGGTVVRHMLQPTELYRALHKTLSNPGHLRNGVMQDHKIQRTLSEQWSGSRFTGQREAVSIMRAEEMALSRRDIPRFSVMSDGDELYHGDREVTTGFFGETGIGRALDGIERMSETDKAYQKGLIRACLGDSSSVFGLNRGESR